MNQMLVGKKEICSFMRRSWKIIEGWIETRGFPATKINGMWESDAELITEWRRRQITKATSGGSSRKTKAGAGA